MTKNDFSEKLYSGYYAGKDLVDIDRKNTRLYSLYKEGAVILSNVSEKEFNSVVAPIEKSIQAKHTTIKDLGYITQVIDSPKYKERIEQNRKEKILRLQEFKEAALKDVGLSGHKNAYKIYNNVYEKWHRSGLEEVWSHLEEFASLAL